MFLMSCLPDTVTVTDAEAQQPLACVVPADPWQQTCCFLISPPGRTPGAPAGSTWSSSSSGDSSGSNSSGKAAGQAGHVDAGLTRLQYA